MTSKVFQTKSSGINTIIISRERLLKRLSHLKHPIPTPSIPSNSTRRIPESEPSGSRFILPRRRQLSQVSDSLLDERLLCSRTGPEQTYLGEDGLRSAERAEARADRCEGDFSGEDVDYGDDSVSNERRGELGC